MLTAQSSPLSTIAFAVVVLATSTAIVAALAWAARRLLGLPVGALRALIAGLLGFLVAYFLGRSLQATQPGHQAAFIGVAIGVPLIVAMVFIGRGTGAKRNAAAAVGGHPRHAAGDCALTTLLADQPHRGAPWPRPLPARAGAAPRGRR
jgi:predicted Na+-dependent transporter